MSAVDFHLVDVGTIDDSSIKRDFIKNYHQSGADVNVENNNVKFYFGENHLFIQVGNGYLEFDIRIRRANGNNFTNADVIRLVKNALLTQYTMLGFQHQQGWK